MDYPDARAIAQKFIRVTPQRSEDFEKGVLESPKDWEKNTIGAETNYEQGVQKAITRKAFGRGVKKCGSARQKSKTIIKGKPRWIEGVGLAEEDMTKAMESVVAVARSIVLPPRYPARDPRNIERVRVIAKALGDAKEQGRI